ncbi:Gem-associated protein 5 [Gryganskiella cystojenkinii]|nr:Gem-associated protein 5 [Gryganskiella cystojenkinii]
MDDFVFPPSPQWHQSHSASICALSKEEGWLLYSLNNSIHIMNPFSLKYEGIMTGAHTGRINSIASKVISKEATTAAATATTTESTSKNVPYASAVPPSSPSPSSKIPFVASGSEDATVVCWDLVSRQPMATSRIHKKPVKAVEWMSNGKTIISGDQGGLLAVWDPFSGTTISKQLDKMTSFVCIEASPSQEHIVAIGLDGGDILICQASTESITIIRRLHGHTAKIQSLAWQPGPSGGDDLASKVRKYTLLASGSADQTVRIWDAENGVCTKVIDLPEHNEESGSSNFQKSRTWVPVGWILDGNSILSSTCRGTMYRFPVDSSRSDNARLSLGRQHIRQVFQVLVWPTGTFAFTISLDRRIVAWDLEKDEGVAQIDCIGGSVQSLDISPIEPGIIAMGLASETIKIWNTLSQNEPYETLMMDRLQSRVRVVKWHPSEEGKLCYGLESGKIGMVENMSNSPTQQQIQQRGKGHSRNKRNKKNSPKSTIFQTYHQRSVVSMQWCTPKALAAPVPELFDMALSDSTLCILSCGADGKILISNPSKPNGKSLDMEVVIQHQNREYYQAKKAVKGSRVCNRTDFHVHPNEDLIAIGNTDGSVEVFELKYFKLVFVFQGHSSKVNRVRWNFSGDESDRTPVREATSYLLASGYDHGALAVHNLAAYSSKAMAERALKSTNTEINAGTFASVPLGHEPVLPTAASFAALRHHTRSISDIAWSPHDGDDRESGPAEFQRIVTSSYDGRVVVYQIFIGDLLSESSTTNGELSEAKDEGSSERDQGEPSTTVQTDMEDSSSIPTEQDTIARPERRCHRPIACLDMLADHALSVHWSLSDVDRIYSGGNDWRLISWDWRAHPYSKPKPRKQDRGAIISAPKEQSAALSPTPSETISAQGSSVGDQSDTALSEMSTPASTHSEPEVIALETQEEHAAFNKRMLDVAELESSPKRLRGPANSSATNSNATTNTNGPHSIIGMTTAQPFEKLRLFPKSSDAFQKLISKKRTCLEIIRLARNFYCRHRRHRGVLVNDTEIEEARLRWQDMLTFLKKDGDPEGLEMARSLSGEMDEMNMDQEEDDEMTDKDNNSVPTTPASGTITDSLAPTDDNSDSLALLSQSESQSASEQEEESMFDGDLVFYGSRESIKALAELESLEAAKTPNNVFTTSSGLGVPLPADAMIASRRNTSSNKSMSINQKTSQLCRIPVTYWMGDVPQMTEILGTLHSHSNHQFGIQDWIGLALAPMGGVDAWRQLMARTANKFVASSEPHAAALCFLALGQVFEAVEAYRKSNMHREAMMLFRIRMWDDDEDDNDDSDENENGNSDVEDSQENEVGEIAASEPKKSHLSAKSTTSRRPCDLHRRILTEWGQALEKRGHYEQACKCHLALEALLVKMKRKPPSSSLSSSLSSSTTVVASSVGLQTLARRHDLLSMRTVAAVAILIHDPSMRDYVGRYEGMLAQKQELDRRKKH